MSTDHIGSKNHPLAYEPMEVAYSEPQTPCNVENSPSYQNLVCLIEKAWNLREKDTQQALTLSQGAIQKIYSLPLEKRVAKNLQANIFRTLSYLYMRLGAYDLGLVYAFKSLEICRELALAELYVINLQILGWCYTYLGNFSEGLKPFLEALEMCQEEEHNHLKIDTLIGLSTLYYQMDDFERALKFEEEALNIFKSPDEPQKNFHSLIIWLEHT